MKKIVCLFFVWVWIGCQSKSPVATLPEASNPNDTINLTTKTMEPIRKFDKKRYYENLDPNEGIEYIFTDSNGYNIRQFEAASLFVEEIRNPESLFILKNAYDKETGKLKETGLTPVNGNFLYGVWKTYDDAGYLVEAINYELPYGFTWEDVLEFMKKEKIDLQASYTHISRANDPVAGKFWRISWDTKDKSEGKPLRSVELDGDTGEILSDKRYKKSE